MASISNVDGHGRSWVMCGAIVGAVGVAIGAFGAHGLPGYLAGQGYDAVTQTERLQQFHTGARYQMFHALAIVLVGILHGRQDPRWLRISAWSFVAGVAIFSGLLYALAITGPDWRKLGAIVPIGGLLLITGWSALAASARSRLE